jgi:serine/threonine-protein kinase
MTEGAAFSTAKLTTLVDQRLTKYEIQEKISEGGFGTVYRAYDPVIKRVVAIKTCTTPDEEIRSRFLREAEIAGNLDHPNIVKVFDLGFDGGLPFIVQEFLSGQDLDHLIARDRFLTHPEKLLALLQIARGLEYAHSHGVVHRDVKPSNVRILDDGTAKLLDFGIATLQQENLNLTQEGMAVGTAAYLAPEQVKGAAATPQTDIFSYGVLAYELLSGIRPFGGETISSVLFQIVNERPAPLSSHCPELRPLLTGLIDRCLRKDPSKRPPGFGYILTTLERVREGERRNPVLQDILPREASEADLDLRPIEQPEPTRKELAEVRLEPVPAQPRDPSGALRIATARPRAARSWLWWALLLTAIVAAWLWQAEVRGTALLEDLVLELRSNRADTTAVRRLPGPPVEEALPPSPAAVARGDELARESSPTNPPEPTPQDSPQSLSQNPAESTPRNPSESTPRESISGSSTELPPGEDTSTERRPSLSPTLPPEPQSGPASLQFTAGWHPRMTVSVDGGPPIPLARTANRTVPAGSHTLTFSLLTARFRAVETLSVELPPGAQRVVSSPIQPPGALTIQASLGSAQAKVLVNGKLIGVSPLRHLLYPAGSYRITLSSREGSGPSLKTTVTLQKARETILTFDLQRPEQFLLRHRPLDRAHSIWKEP